MKPFEVRFTREAEKDSKKLTPALKQKLREILTAQVSIEPYAGKRLVATCRGSFPCG